MPDKTKNSESRIFKRIISFYIEGFKSMTIGKYLWALIIIKLVILFLVVKLFFFPNFLNSKFDTDEEKSEYVRSSLISHKQ